MDDHDPYITRKLRDYARIRDIYSEDTSSERSKVMIAAADEIDRFRSNVARLEEQLLEKRKMIAKARGALGCRAWEDE